MIDISKGISQKDREIFQATPEPNYRNFTNLLKNDLNKLPELNDKYSHSHFKRVNKSLLADLHEGRGKAVQFYPHQSVEAS